MKLAHMAIVVGCTAGCTDVSLRSVEGVDDKVAVSGQFCTPPPTDTVHQVDVLFLVDSSPSLQWNDPNDLLVSAMDQVTRTYLTGGGKNVKFAVVRFGLLQSVHEDLDYAASDYPGNPTPPRFTNDDAELQNIFTRMRAPVCTQTTPTLLPANCNPKKYLDGTNYVLGLQLAKQYIDADIATNPANIVNNRYIIEFVTDGMPQALGNDPAQTVQAINSAVLDLHARDDVRVDVILVAQTVVVPPEFISLLPTMAKTGGGAYLQLNTPGDLQTAFNTALSTDTKRLVEYELANYFVYNRNLILTTYPPGDALSTPSSGQFGAYVDSDGDGLVDQLEIDVGLNPGAFDTSGDGLSDWFKYTLRNEFDPLAKNVGNRGVDGDLDPDGDGLTTFEENHLGTDPLRADTDSDGIPDDIELLVGTDPTAADTQGDPDQDQIPNGDEVRQHMSPLIKEDAATRKTYSYVTAPPGTPTANQDGVRCYAFKVENIKLAKTLSSVDRSGLSHPAGMNTLEVVVIAKPVADPNNPALSGTATSWLPYQQVRARPWIIYRGQGQRDPEATELYVQPSDFK